MSILQQSPAELTDVSNGFAGAIESDVCARGFCERNVSGIVSYY
jgi:hypothetical protein